MHIYAVSGEIEKLKFNLSDRNSKIKKKQPNKNVFRSWDTRTICKIMGIYHHIGRI